MKRIEKKPLSTGKKLLVMLFFSISMIFLGIFLGFYIKYLYLGFSKHDDYLLDESLIALIFSFVTGLLFFITLIVLLRSYDLNKKEKNMKWYIDKILVALTPVCITIAMVLYSFFEEDDEIIYLAFSIILFLVIGIVTTPNVIMYVIKDMKNWKDIFYKNGNLGTTKKPTGFYKMQSPVSFEKKIYFKVLKNQLLDINTVILIILIFLSLSLFNHSHSIPGIKGNLIYSFLHVKSTRAEGYMFFISVFLAAFWIPILAYYITNTVYKLRIVKRHEYIVYHAIVDKVDTFKIRISNSGFHYKYDYCSCVGIKAKDVNKTKSILIFIPDDVILFPDIAKN